MGNGLTVSPKLNIELHIIQKFHFWVHVQKNGLEQLLLTMFTETLLTKDIVCNQTKEDRFWYKLCEDIVLDNPVTEEQMSMV